MSSPVTEEITPVRKRKVPLRTAAATVRSTKNSTKPVSTMGTRSIPISMPDKQEAALFNLLTLLTGNKNNRSEMARSIFAPYLEVITSILRADGLFSEQNKFMLTIDEAEALYDPENLDEDLIMRNIEIFKRAEEANPQLNFGEIIRPDKLFNQKST